MRRTLAGGLLIALLLAAAAVWWLQAPAADLRLAPAAPEPVAAVDPARVAAGERLAQFGHCAGCHTARGGAPWAGGRAIATPFGTVHTPNLTPDPATGLGRWTEAAFVRALRQGVAADGRRLVPACPYPNFSHVADEDLRLLYAYLRSLPPRVQPAREHALRFPYGTQTALAAWQLLQFRPPAAPQRPEPADALARGRYLVQGLGHCSACHGQYNAWGATDGPLDLRGGALPLQGWVAPALDAAHEAGVADWPLADIVALLHSGRSPQATVAGPMAMVVKNSTQHLSDADVLAVATFLKSLPQRPAPPPGPVPLPAPELRALGERVYAEHCASCHGERGEGVAGLMPALAGNRAVVLASPVNLLRVVLGGGYAPATRGNPQPEGMPPFSTVLNDAEIAAVATYLRSAWGHAAAPVSALEVNRQRGGGGG
jgi:mono/diheme cytochrome c family protein